MYVIDLEGNEYPIQVTSTNENETNGNQSLSATILATKVNQAFIADIAEMWRIVDHDNVEHKIIYAKRKGFGTYQREYDYIKGDDTYFLNPTQPVKNTVKNKLKQSTNLSVEIKAIPLFFDEFDNDRIYERYDKHMTALEAFQRIFQGTNFDFSLGDQFDAVQWEGFGAGESRLETFKRALERYKCEFRISGNMIFLERRIGRDTQFQYRHRLNASNIEQEIDANEMWTFARGYGDYGGEGETTEDDKEDWERAKLEREYTSPLAKIIGIRHAPPLKNGNITTKSKMDRELKALVDESLKISVSADIYDLQKQGYPVAQSEVGDRVFLIDPRIGLDDEVRVVSQSKTRNWKGDVIDLNITFGSEKIAKRHQTNLTTAAKEINDLIAGRKKLPYSVLPAAEQAALKALNEARTELIFGNAENGVQGIIAQDKDDPNRMMWINSAGWMISTDGGATSHVAATADGIVADVITAGTINADQVAIMGGDGDSYAYISGAYAEFRGQFKRTWLGETTNYNVKTKLDRGHLRFRNDDERRSLYFSEFGISTYIDGEGADEDDGSSVGSSGSIIWWDRTHSPSNVNGITVNSYGGTAALTSDRHHALIKSRYSTSIESTESSVNVMTHSDDTGTEFTFTKSSDRRDGYLVYGKGGQIGLRFVGTGSGRVQVVDTDYSTGGSTEIEAGAGRFNEIVRRDGNRYLDIASSNHLRVGTASNGDRRIEAPPVYARTSSNGSNVRITNAYTLTRTTSASKYKNVIEKQFKDTNEQLNHSLGILNLNVSSWYDKYECDTYSEEIEKGCKIVDENFKLKRHVGLVAEDVEESGFTEHVVYNNGELEEIEYDRLWIHLIPIIKDQQARIEELEAKL